MAQERFVSSRGLVLFPGMRNLRPDFSRIQLIWKKKKLPPAHGTTASPLLTQFIAHIFVQCKQNRGEQHKDRQAKTCKYKELLQIK